MRKHYPLNSNGAEDAGKLPWIDGVPSTGVEGSYPGQALFVDMESEILAAIDASGQSRNGADLTQLMQAIGRGIYLGQFGGTPNALTAALPNNVVFSSLLRSVRFGGYVTTTNTAGVTIALTCLSGANPVVSVPLLTRAGAALKAGDLPVNQDFDFRWDGAALRMIGAVASEAVPLAALGAAKVPFNYQASTVPTRTNASASTSGLQVPVMANLMYPKKSGTSNIVVTCGFQSFAPVQSGVGNGAATSRLVTSSGAYADFGINSTFLQSNGSIGGSGTNTPTLVLAGVPAGSIGLGLTYRRDDSFPWNTIFNPNASDAPGSNPNPVSYFFIYEYEPGT